MIAGQQYTTLKFILQLQYPIVFHKISESIHFQSQYSKINSYLQTYTYQIITYWFYDSVIQVMRALGTL